METNDKTPREHRETIFRLLNEKHKKWDLQKALDAYLTLDDPNESDFFIRLIAEMKKRWWADYGLTLYHWLQHVAIGANPQRRAAIKAALVGLTGVNSAQQYFFSKLFEAAALTESPVPKWDFIFHSLQEGHPISGIIPTLDEYLRMGDPSEITFFNQLISQMANRTSSDWDILWDWFLRISKTADDSRRSALKIALYESISEDPLNEEWLLRLFKCLGDKSTAWIVAAAYENHPRKLYWDICKFGGFDYLGEEEPWVEEPWDDDDDP